MYLSDNYRASLVLMEQGGGGGGVKDGVVERGGGGVEQEQGAGARSSHLYPGSNDVFCSSVPSLYERQLNLPPPRGPGANQLKRKRSPSPEATPSGTPSPRSVYFIFHIYIL